MNEFYINCNGIRVHAKLDFPKAKKEKYPLYIVIHGLTGHMEEELFTEVSNQLNEDGYATLRVDMYGHGKSEGNYFDQSLLLWTDEIIHVVEYARSLESVDKISIIAHSQGGSATVLAGGMLNEFIQNLILLAPAIVLRDYYKNGEFLGKAFDVQNIPDQFEMDGKAFSSNHIRISRFMPFEACAREFRNPILIVHGTDDIAVPISYSEELVQYYEKGTLIKIENDGHNFRKHLDQVLEAIHMFIGGSYD